jgi:hypothetical protein
VLSGYPPKMSELMMMVDKAESMYFDTERGVLLLRGLDREA